MSSVPPRESLLTGVCVAAAVAGGVTVVAAAVATGLRLAHPALFGFFLGLLLLLQVLPLRIWHGGQEETMQLEETLFIPMCLFLSGLEVVLAMGLAVTAANLVRRRGALKTSFNAGEMVTAVGLGLLVARALGAHPGAALHPGPVIGALLGGITVAVASALAVMLVISVAQGASPRSLVLDGARVRLFTWGGSISMGTLMAVAALAKGWALLAMVVPLVLLDALIGWGLGQWRERRRIERLYRAAGSVQGSIDGSEVRQRVVNAARDLLEATEAEIVADSRQEPRGALRASFGEDQALQVRGRVGRGSWGPRDADLLRALAAVASTASRNASLYEQLRVVCDNLAEGLVAVGPAGGVEMVNPAAVATLGWDADGLEQAGLHAALHGGRAGHDTDDCPLLESMRTGRPTESHDDEFAAVDGRAVPVAWTAAPIRGDDGVAGCVITFRDIGERKAFLRRLEYQAFHDDLTGLPNRALFLDRLSHALDRAEAGGTIHALLFIDLDRFKVVNDSLGHQAGDRLIDKVADRLGAILRPGDTLARFGGDEFTVLVEDVVDAHSAVVLGERIIDGLRRPFDLEGREVFVSASVGVVIGGAGSHRDEMLSSADLAMYEAKAMGKGRVVIFDDRARLAAVDRLDLETALRRAISHPEQLVVHYQPVVSTVDGRIVSLEALVRWRHPELGMLLPGAFVPLAEETGLIGPIGVWVLEQACAQVRAWQRQIPAARHLRVAVNLAPQQLHQSTLVGQVRQVLATSGLAADDLCLELTEGALLEGSTEVTATLRALKDLGVLLGIDDFGTGWSSLSYLKRFPVDVVKIDRSFTSGIESPGVDADIISAILALSQAIGAEAVAEGVETPAQLEGLRAAGCTLAQGWLLGRPAPAAEVEAVLDGSVTVLPLRRAAGA